jgi:hypothetical protein
MLTIMRRLEAIDLSRPAALLKLPQPGRSCQPDIAVAVSTTIDPLAGDRGFESTSLQRLDNHSAHVSKETTAWLAAQPVGRFTFTFTPKHGSWLNIIEGFFSKLARSVLRHIRVSSKHELKERLMAFIDDINHQPIVPTWHYKIDDAV